MRAIIETGGMQFPIEEKTVIKAPKLDMEIKQKFIFDKVMLISGSDKFIVGKPYIEGAKVEAEVLAHGKFDKITVLKFKKRRKYRKRTGHSQNYTEVKILSISA